MNVVHDNIIAFHGTICYSLVKSVTKPLKILLLLLLSLSFKHSALLFMFILQKNTLNLISLACVISAFHSHTLTVMQFIAVSILYGAMLNKELYIK